MNKGPKRQCFFQQRLSIFPSTQGKTPKFSDFFPSYKDTDIFITGSSSKLLSSELSTFFTGRYVDLKVNTLNFAETLDFKKALGQPIADTPTEFSFYLQRGGFPSLYVSTQTERQDDSEVSDIYNSILYKDFVERKNIRNTSILSRVAKFVMDNIGSPISAKSISDYLKKRKDRPQPRHRLQISRLARRSHDYRASQTLRSPRQRTSQNSRKMLSI